MKRLIFELIFLPSRIINCIILKLRHVEYGKNLDIRGTIGIYRSGKLKIGNNVKINSSRFANPLGNKTVFEISNDAIVEIGNDVGISGSIIKSFEKIVIEDKVLIGAGCMIMDTDSHPLGSKKMSPYNVKGFTKPILIKYGAFIGARSIILKGVTIGGSSVVAAGSVVTKSIPDNELWGGSPAVFIREINAKTYMD